MSIYDKNDYKDNIYVIVDLCKSWKCNHEIQGTLLYMKNKNIMVGRAKVE